MANNTFETTHLAIPHVAWRSELIGLIGLFGSIPWENDSDNYGYRHQ